MRPFPPVPARFQEVVVMAEERPAKTVSLEGHSIKSPEMEPQTTIADAEENALIALRREKLARLRQTGAAFPNDFRRNALADDLHARYGGLDDEALDANPVVVSVAGRLVARRVMGKASFGSLQDMSGRIQLFIQRDALGEAVYGEFKGWDVGDIVGAVGTLFKTRTGELSVRVTELRLLTKSLRPLPEKWHGLQDQETRYRQRYLDLIANPDSASRFRMRSRIIQHIRHFFDERGFLEVETPMMQPIPGGATARPFQTHHHALDMPLYLRIAPELYLKRLVVGGFERVYEINRNFRNEGVSTRHNPEFTMLEFYQAYADYRDLMALTETLLRGLAQDIVGGLSLRYQGMALDLGMPFERLSVIEAVARHNPTLDADRLRERNYLAEVCKARGIKVESSAGWGKLLTELFEATVEHQLIQPTFITHYPAEVSPLARVSDNDPELTDRFEFFVTGREIANGFSELNDAEDQAERFQAQVARKDSGDDEAMYFDADYIVALEHGLAPTAGEGIGIDRLVMLFTDAASIRDVLLFPHMRAR